MNPLWGWALNGGILLTLWTIGNKKRYGFLVGFGMECMWLYWSIFEAGMDYGFMFFSVVFAAMYLRNYFKWKKEEVGQEAA